MHKGLGIIVARVSGVRMLGCNGRDREIPIIVVHFQLEFRIKSLKGRFVSNTSGGLLV